MRTWQPGGERGWASLGSGARGTGRCSTVPVVPWPHQKDTAPYRLPCNARGAVRLRMRWLPFTPVGGDSLIHRIAGGSSRVMCDSGGCRSGRITSAFLAEVSWGLHREYSQGRIAFRNNYVNYCRHGGARFQVWHGQGGVESGIEEVHNQPASSRAGRVVLSSIWTQIVLLSN